MDIYRKDFTVLTSDADLHGEMHVSALFTYLQNAALAHAKILGADKKEMMEKGLLWVVIMQEAAIHRMPVYDEHLTLLSWAGRSMHAFFPRVWQIRGEQDEMLVEATALWGLMDAHTRRLVMPAEHGVVLKKEHEGPVTKLPLRIRSSQAGVLRTFTVPFSYTDLNGHMNNVRYFDLAADCMSPEMHRRKISSIRAEYIEECTLGETITLRAAASEDTWYFAGETDHPLFRLQYRFHDSCAVS